MNIFVPALAFLFVVLTLAAGNPAGHNADFAMGGPYVLAFVYLSVLGLVGACAEIGDWIDAIASANNVSEPAWL